jgi:hypothetical protein
VPRGARASARRAAQHARRQTMTEPMLEDAPRRRVSLRDQLDCVPVYVV